MGLFFRIINCKDFYSFEEAAKILKQIVTSMYQAGKEKNIEMKSLVGNYNTALKNQDKKGMDAAIREMGIRLDYNLASGYFIDKHQVKYNCSHKMNTQNLKKAQNIAKEHGAKITEDLVGDGILGNTQSKSVTKKGQIILDALNELMKTPEIKERIEACFVRDRDCFNLYFPKTNEQETLSEYGLMTANYIADGVVGDGDMSFIVRGIMRCAERENFDVKDLKSTKEFIIELFKPQLFH